jgi:fatty acid desaturase
MLGAPIMTRSVDLEAPPAATRGSEFAALQRRIRDEGLLDRRRGNYAVRIGCTLLAFALAWTAFALVGNSWYQLIVAVAVGLTCTQVAFLGHDGGHQQIGRTKRGNDLIGLLVGDLFVGLSFGWWLDKHNRHHSHPNHEGHDPDIGESVLAFTQAHVTDSTGKLRQLIFKHQAWLFFPMLTLEGFQLHVASAQSLFSRKPRRYRRSEIVLFTVHVLAYLIGIFTVLSPAKAVVFIVLHQAVFGLYMGCSFAPNHKGMPVIPPEQKLDFLRRQVLTSRNVRGGWFTDILLGGLNYQIEHHLFPNMPRPNLRKAQPIVRDYCEQQQISYTETSLVGSYAAALGYLNDLGEPLRRPA